MQGIISNLLSELEEDVCELQMSAEKAKVMANNITNEYFCDVDINTTTGKAMLCYYFDSTRIKHDILSDYVREVNRQAEKINNIQEKLIEAERAENNNFGGNL